MARQQEIAALVFDVQGTLLDFFGPVSRVLSGALTEALHRLGSLPAGTPRAADLVNRWRRSYFTGMQAVLDRGGGFVPVADIYRGGLDDVLHHGGLDSVFSAAERDVLNAAWTQLEPWPDTVAGLSALRPHYVLAALTNGGLASTVRLVARHDLGFHLVLAGELVRSYKPDPALYRLALSSLGYPAERVMMVASHAYDLDAARGHGMRTAFLRRPLEYGPDVPPVPPPPGADIVADDVWHLARLLAERAP